MLQIWTNNHRDYHAQLARLKWRANMAMVVIQLVLAWQIGSYSEGIVAGRLPFNPLGFVAAMTHRGLQSEDMQEVSLFCIFMLTQMSLRGTISKLLGNPEGPRMPLDYQTPAWLNEYAKQYQ